jgi:hypothetical protein
MGEYDKGEEGRDEYFGVVKEKRRGWQSKLGLGLNVG